MTATWDGDALVMSQQANTPYGDFGFVARRGGWIRWQAGLREALQNTSSDLRLRAVAYTVDDRVGYIIGD